MGVAGIAGAGVQGATSLAAAGVQANSAKQAQQYQAQEAANALGFQQTEFNAQQANQAPFIQAGQGAVQQLAQGTQPGGALVQPWTGQFTAPTAQQAAQTPGYQFQLQQGENALQNSAAAQGGLTSGATGAALEQYGQGLASTNYQQVYNNSLQQYQQAYNTFQQNQANQYNRLAGLAGTGQTSVGQLGQTGQAAAGNVGSISLGTGAQQGQSLQNAGGATASGYVGAGNALSGGLNSLGGAMALSSLLGGGGNNPLGVSGANGLYVPNIYTGQ